ncbi:hypothetical protein T10_3888 [Trichinella papuae]|uniref:Uncharacterized protein n=1 Tax=Trichinella papuae TaxID=268474 RepID=A0A0V1MHR8_9BILA|nr:hypothetical protein T10_3888 [Trichinella papuae]
MKPVQSCYIHFCPAVLRNVAEPGLQTRVTTM